MEHRKSKLFTFMSTNKTVFLNLTPTNKNTFFWFLEAKNVQNFV